jgi:hypothetical protein
MLARGPLLTRPSAGGFRITEYEKIVRGTCVEKGEEDAFRRILPTYVIELSECVSGRCELLS